jgi:general secretion pathway protein D
VASQRTGTVLGICLGIAGTLLLSGPRLRSAAAASEAAGAPGGDVQAAARVTGAFPVQVSGVTIHTSKNGATLVDIATSGTAPYSVLELKNPPRVVVDLKGARKATTRRTYSADSALLERVRIGQYQSGSPAVVRVVADLHGNPAFEVHATPSGVRIELKPRGVVQSPTPPIAQGPPQRPAQPPTTQPAQQPPVARPPAAAPPQPQPAQMPPPAMPVAMGAPSTTGASFQRIPFTSLTQCEKLLDSLGLRIVLSFGYRKGEPNEAAWKTKGAPGVAASRVFIKPLGPGSYRTAELAISPSPQSGFELVICGQQVQQNVENPNPDLPAIQQVVNGEIARLEQKPPTPDERQLGYETYYLSYVTADRAIALLKTLGYTTVEYNQQAGESLYDKIYNPLKLGGGRPPIVVKLIDSTKTSIMEPTTTTPGAPVAGQPMPIQTGGQMMGGGMGAITTGVPPLGGTFLSHMTSGDTAQRLLILYDKNDPESLQPLLNLMETTIDVPSRQILIEALVVELNASKIRNLGVTFETVQNSVDVANAAADSTTGAPLSIFTFTKGAPQVSTFTASLQALLQTSDAQILSNPSVLVLDDRQALIQIGQQVPVTQSLTTAAGITQSAEYFPVGIVLNLRPRINEDGSEITMQTETIVSSINRAATQQLPGTAAIVAPVIDNRQVKSIVRVANNTPFIIGGLISTTDQTALTGIPFLSQIPLIGNLFRSTTLTKLRQEVIIVVTPHVVPLEDRYFSYVIPKDSSTFDRFNYKLFRNAYRIRGSDIFDLEFIHDSNMYKQLVSRVKAESATDPQLGKEEPFASVLKGGAPGEDIWVRRMLWEIIDRTHYARYVNPSRIIYYRDDPTSPDGSGFRLAYLMNTLRSLKKGESSVALTFDAQPKGAEGRPFVPPKAAISYPDVTAQNYPEMLISGNQRNPDGSPRSWEVLIPRDKNYSGIRVSPLELLQGVIVLKRLLELNKTMPLTLNEFHIGRQIIFPSQEELRQGYHLVDREVAQLFYEVYNYYPAFEQEFNRQAHYMNALLDKSKQQ